MPNVAWAHMMAQKALFRTNSDQGRSHSRILLTELAVWASRGGLEDTSGSHRDSHTKPNAPYNWAAAAGAGQGWQ